MSGADAEPAIAWWRRARAGLRRHRPLELTWKLLVLLVGGSILLAGLVMFVTPGPRWLGVLAGLAILATEFTWAERLLGAARRRAMAAKDKALDPETRRTTLVATGLVVVCVGLLAAWWVHIEGVPERLVAAWDWVRGVVGGRS